MHDDHQDQFKPNTTVAAVVVANNKFLLVEETDNGQTVFNQPAGHLEANENLISACQRELTEETGLTQTPQYCSGIYYFHRPEFSLYYLRFCFVVELDEELNCQPQDDDILACHWLSYEEILKRQHQLRSPMVLQCINDYLAGQRIENTLLKTNIA